MPWIILHDDVLMAYFNPKTFRGRNKLASNSCDTREVWSGRQNTITPSFSAKRIVSGSWWDEWPSNSKSKGCAGGMLGMNNSFIQSLITSCLSTPYQIIHRGYFLSTQELAIFLEKELLVESQFQLC